VAYLSQMTWSDFDTDSALERDVLRRALPLVPTVSDGSRRITVDQITGTMHAALTFGDTLGPTPAGCIDLLGIRPLLVGTAWKIIDLLLEAALDADNQKPPNNRLRWRIDEKINTAIARTARPSLISSQAWDPLMGTYVATADLRHSLVHRRVHTDAANALIGHDSTGVALRPLTPGEQEALARTALRAAELVTASSGIFTACTASPYRPCRSPTRFLRSR
jgi:hypothetical protein